MDCLKKSFHGFPGLMMVYEKKWIFKSPYMIFKVWSENEIDSLLGPEGLCVTIK